MLRMALTESRAARMSRVSPARAKRSRSCSTWQLQDVDGNGGVVGLARQHNSVIRRPGTGVADDAPGRASQSCREECARRGVAHAPGRDVPGEVPGQASQVGGFAVTRFVFCS